MIDHKTKFNQVSIEPNDGELNIFNFEKYIALQNNEKKKNTFGNNVDSESQYIISQMNTGKSHVYKSKRVNLI